MQIIDFKELISFIEDSPEKSIPKSILIKEIHKMKKDSESHIQKAARKINRSILATIIYIIANIIFVTYSLYTNGEPLLMNLHLLDIFIPSILCIGIILKKRIASLGILFYFIISSYIHLDIQGIGLFSFLLVVTYSYIYLQGYRASKSYHKHSVLRT